jgi:hypothetical protein
MSTNRERRMEQWERTFSTGVQTWLFFLVALLLVKYPAPLSIFLGFVGGVAAAFLTWWWYEEPPETEQSHQQPTNEGE